MVFIIWISVNTVPYNTEIKRFDWGLDHMEGTIAVLGFWICIMAAIMKKPLMAYIEKSKITSSKGLADINQRVCQLESLLSTLNHQLNEISAANEFSQKLLIESAKKLTESEQLLIERANQSTVLIEDAK